MGGVKERHQGTRCTSIRMSSLSHSLSVIRAKYAQNVLISACAGAAVCAGAYIMWGPDNLFRTRGIVYVLLVSAYLMKFLIFIVN